MVRTKWRGDRANLLPAHQVEPYRLWFEFLQIASKDADVFVDHSIYARWDDYRSMRFDEWWSDHWRDLFAVEFGVREIIDGADIRSVGDREIMIAVPLYQSPSKTISQVRRLLEDKGAKERVSDAPSGSFRPRVLDANDNEIPLTHRFLKNLSKIRLYLRLYRYWTQNNALPHRKRLEQTAIDYFEWAQAWNRKVSAKRGDKRPRAELPACISEYVRIIRARNKKELGREDDGHDRRQFVRYLRKAAQIARNVGNGDFPGHYEKPGRLVPSGTVQD
jgi:hypothetical protein